MLLAMVEEILCREASSRPENGEAEGPNVIVELLKTLGRWDELSSALLPWNGVIEGKVGAPIPDPVPIPELGLDVMEWRSKETRSSCNGF